MQSLADYIGYANLAVYTAVALVALRQWRRHRDPSGLWAALAFVALALVIDLGRVIPEDGGRVETVATRLQIVILVLFPYLLYRFTGTFARPRRRLAIAISASTLAMVAWSLLLPSIPDERPWPTWFSTYVIGFLVHWTVLSLVVAYRLWTAGRGEPGVARRRMQLLALGATAITVALFVAAFGGERAATDLVTALLASTSALSFLVGLAPPAGLRLVWRRREQARLQAAVTELMTATTHSEVIERVLPRMAEIVAARAVELRGEDGELLGEYGEPTDAEGGVIRLEIPGAALVVWTSPYAPFFGAEELALLRALGGLTMLAIDRARLFARERDARVALERADELKTNFIALAAHELRTPAATIHGLAETLYSRRVDLDAEQLHELERVLREQTRRMTQLVDQLLDLSRLDAEAVKITPEPLRVRERVESVVTTAAGDRAGEVEVAVEPELVATVDPNAFERIVSNLIVNALRYGAPPVTVAAHQNDRHFRLTVEDRGAGVADQFVPNLFERFARSDASRDRSPGTGLGLAIARSYAHAHRGELLYERAQPHGARFELVLPLQS